MKREKGSFELMWGAFLFALVLWDSQPSKYENRKKRKTYITQWLTDSLKSGYASSSKNTGKSQELRD